MSYDIRLFAMSHRAVPLAALRTELADYNFHVLEGSEKDWHQLLVMSRKGHEICVVERATRPVMSREIASLRRDLDDCRPRSAVTWANAYMNGADVLYGCRYLSFGFSKAYAVVPCRVLWTLQALVGNGIIHADGQGFSNEDGYQITWEFAERTAGLRQVAILDGRGHWLTFEMDVQDERQLSAFQAGQRPRDAELLEFN